MSCKNCGQSGHNRATCRAGKEELPEKYKILQESRAKVERVEINGNIPQKGLWLVNPTTNRVAGKILFVKRKGQIVWSDFMAAQVESEQSTFIQSGYEYRNDLPTGEQWKYLNLGEWSKNFVMKESTVDEVSLGD